MLVDLLQRTGMHPTTKKYLIKNAMVLALARWLSRLVSSPYTKAAGSISSQGAYKNQPMSA